MTDENPTDKFLGKLAEGIYEDGLKPSVANLGETVGFLFKAIAYYPKFWSKVLDIKYEDKVAKFESEYKERFEKIKLEDRILPPPRMIGPIVQALEYGIFEDDLRTMFANLLAASSDLKASVHPSFVEIIRQLSPIDARFLKIMQSMNSDSVGVARLNIKMSDHTDITTIRYLPTFIDQVAELKLDEIVASIENLIRLGIYEPTFEKYIASENGYEEIYTFMNSAVKDSPYEKKIYSYSDTRENTPDFNSWFMKGVLLKTKFGSAFMNACLDKE